MRGSLVFAFYVTILLGLSGLAKADGGEIINMTCTWSENSQGMVLQSVPPLCMDETQKIYSKDSLGRLVEKAEEPYSGDIMGRLANAKLRYCADPVGDRYLMNATSTEKRGSYFTVAQQCRLPSR